ncbi:MAG TPA: SRPBCC family protein [Pyrinomonadaceae bacterium]|nr:SRPBCC family protein [Pyrinomonadaceae bacterium]
MNEPIHQEVVFQTSADRIYKALTDGAEFKEMTGGAPTEISSDVGGAFSCFGGMITGLNLELVPNQRIVQAWRARNWEPGLYSIVKYELNQQGDETCLVLDHSGFPADIREHLEAGWTANYWELLRKHLTS